MERDETRVTPMPRPSGRAWPRFVLGVTFLSVGLGDLLFMNIVLLPHVLAVESPSPARPKASVLPVAVPAVQAGMEAERGAGQVLGEAPAAPIIPPVAPPASVAPSAPATSSFSPLLFTRSTAWLSPQAEDALAKVAVVMKEDAALRVRLEGHADESGAAHFNSVLSLKRAQRARERLQDLGIEQARIDIQAHGSQRPADTKRTAQARARNRRVEIVLY